MISIASTDSSERGIEVAHSFELHQLAVYSYEKDGSAWPGRLVSGRKCAQCSNHAILPAKILKLGGIPLQVLHTPEAFDIVIRQQSKLRVGVLLDSIHAATLVSMLSWGPNECTAWLKLHEVPQDLLDKLVDCAVSGKALAKLQDHQLRAHPYYIGDALHRFKLLHT